MSGDNKNKRVIAVVGVPRSGTSAITRGLPVLGVSLGGYVSDEKRKDNEKGFFEDLEINAINLAMLNSVGYRWGNPVSPIVNEDSRKIMSVFLPIAKDIIARRLSSADIFGFKDPMIAVLLPFWKEILEKTGADVSFVIAYRNPLSVANSLKKTNNLDALVSCYIWLAGMLSSLIYTEGFKRVVVDYDDIMADPGKQLSRAAFYLNLEFNPESPEFKEYKDNFLNASLRHASFGTADLLDNPGVPPKITELYVLLRQLASDEIRIDDPATAAKIKKIYSWASELRSTLLYIQAQSDALFSLKKTLEAKDAKIDELTELLKERGKAGR